MYGNVGKLGISPTYGRSFQIAHVAHLRTCRPHFHLPLMLQFYYFQLCHAVHSQGLVTDWSLSPTPVFRYVHSVQDTYGFISRCYGTLLPSYLGYPCNAIYNYVGIL